MLTDGKFTLHEVTIPIKICQPVTLFPFGDVHRDSQAFSEDKWIEFLEVSKGTKNAIYLGMGDYFDSFSTSERMILGNPGLHETTTRNFQKQALEKVAVLAHEIRHMKGNVIGMLGGNHFIAFDDGTTSDQLLARQLGTKYLGAAAAIRITFVCGKAQRHSIDIFAHHGRGAGTTTTGRMNAPEKMQSIFESDIYLMGHNHARGVLPLGDKLRLEHTRSGLSVRSRHCWIGRTGGYLRGYVPNESSYVVDSCMSPTSIGWIAFTFTLRRDRANGKDILHIDIGAIQ